MKTKENKAPAFLSRRLRLKAIEAAIVKSRLKKYNELNDNKQVLIVPNPNSQSAAVLGIYNLDHQELPLRQCLVKYS